MYPFHHLKLYGIRNVTFPKVILLLNLPTVLPIVLPIVLSILAYWPLLAATRLLATTR